MKKGKGILRGILLLAAVVILILLLTMCTKSCGASEEPPVITAAETLASIQTDAAEETEETTEPAPTEETAAETTEPTEEATEEPEEETSATTATTAPADDDEDEEDYGEEEPYVEVPEPGTPENPYVEIREEYPAEIESVNIPGGTSVSYVITGSAGSCITIREPGVTLILDGVSYTADESTGELTVDLGKLAVDPMITLSHSETSAASCILELSEGMGSATNPEPLTEPEELKVSLQETDSDGYHYLWNADITGQVELTLKEKEAAPEETPEEDTDTEETVPAEAPVLEVIVTVGDQTFRLSECEDGKIAFDTVKDQPVLIQVIAQPFADGSYPAVEETLLFARFPAPGTKGNPIMLDSIETLKTVLEAGNVDGLWYRWTADTYATVTLKPDKAELKVSATVGETVYEQTEDTVTFHVDKDQQVLICAIAAAQPGETEEAAPVYPAVSGVISGTLDPDPGTPENPVILQSINTVNVSLVQGDRDGQTSRWTATYGGTLELSMQQGRGSFEVNVTHNGAVRKLENGKLTLSMKAGESVDIQVIAVPGRNGQYGAVRVVLKGTFTEDPGSSRENPITIAEGQQNAAFALEAKQTLYFSGMVQEMIATVENAPGVTIRCGEEAVSANWTGLAQLEFPGEGEEPVVFSVTSEEEKEVTMTFAYPAGHEKNPHRLTLGRTQVELEEMDTDGYLMDWTADCDGQLTLSVEGKTPWQYRVDDLTAQTTGETVADAEPRTLEVKAGTTVRLILWTAAEEDGILPAGTLTVNAGFFDPLLGTEAKPIPLETGEETANTVTVPAGQTLYYGAAAEGMRLYFAGRGVMLLHNGSEYLTEMGALELVCHGMNSVFAIVNPTDQDQTCKLTFAFPQGHRENPAALVMGENTALLEAGSLSGYSFAWTAEGTGLLTVTMTGESGWQYLLINETTGVTGVIHTSGDQPAADTETLEVTKEDVILVTVNTFAQEHPLNAPAGEVTFTAEFVDPTLGMEENPIWLNLEDTITVPAGKTMYCTAKADGMILTVTGSGLKVSHNGAEYSDRQNTVQLTCVGTGTFGHPVFAVTNTAAVEGTYTVSFAYPEGHCQNPARLELGEYTVEPGKNGLHFLWTAEEDGCFVFTVNSEENWKYRVAGVTEGAVGEFRSAEDEEPVITETVEVRAGDQLRIVVNTCGEAGTVTFMAEFSPIASEETE